MPAPEAVRLAREWLDYARQDLSAARAASRDPSFEPRHAGFQAQQAAEKAIKSLLVLEQIQFPFVHDVVALRDNLPASYSLHETDLDLAPLNPWAVEGRYPHELPTNEAAALVAVELAERVVELVERDFEREAGG